MILAAICARQDPKVHYRNCTNTDKLEEWYAVFDDPDEEYEKFIVCYRCRCLGTFVERFELQQFPMDTQVLGFQVCCQAESAPEHGEVRMSMSRDTDDLPATREDTSASNAEGVGEYKSTRVSNIIANPNKNKYKSIVNADK